MKLEVNLGVQSKVTPVIEDVQAWAKDNKKFIKEFSKFILESGAIALSANQLLVDGEVSEARICGFRTGDDECEFWINPKITDVKGKPEPNIETCLTHGFEKLVVADRVKAVKVTYTDVKGSEVKVMSEGDDSLAVQHAIDHLDGIHEFLMDLPQDIDDTIVKIEDVTFHPVKLNRAQTRNKKKRARKKK